jgi:twitching motility two-component system response regulator PilH
MALSDNTILVVEDSVTQLVHLRALLEEEGLEVVIATDGEMGLQMARGLRPGLVILDLQMPRMNGFQVVQELKKAKETAAIPVIMFSTHHELETQTLGMQLGALEYIPKDAFADAVLLETLRQMGFIS